MEAERSDPLAEFKTAFFKYQDCQADIAAFEDTATTDTRLWVGGPDWSRKDRARKRAAENLWVTGMAGLFDILTTNYKAQEMLVAEQLRLARRTTFATVAMAVIAGLAIVASVLGPKFWKDASPAAPQIIYLQVPPFQAAPIDAAVSPDP